MITPQQCLQWFGMPAGKAEGTYMTTWAVPPDLQQALRHVLFSATGTAGFPARIYCHKLLAPRLESALRALVAAGLAAELKTWDGCYQVRRMRGLTAPSLHSWGLAVDLNAATNALGAPPRLSPGFVACFRNAGFEWGGTWARKDGMHFQLLSL